MADLVTAAVGGLFALVANSILGQYLESHRATLGLLAKRRERYFERQATAIIALYELLSKAYDLTSTSGSDERADKVWDLVDEAESYFVVNDLFFPDELRHSISVTLTTMRAMALEMATTTLQDEMLRISREQLRETRRQLDELRDRLRARFHSLVFADDQQMEPSFKKLAAWYKQTTEDPVERARRPPPALLK